MDVWARWSNWSTRHSVPRYPGLVKVRGRSGGRSQTSVRRSRGARGWLPLGLVKDQADTLVGVKARKLSVKGGQRSTVNGDAGVEGDGSGRNV